MQCSPIRLAELVANVLHHYEALAHSKGLDLEHQLSNQIVVLGDERRLRQAIGNLIGTAIKYTPDGGRIVLQLIDSYKEGCHHALLHIHDTGPGIAESDLPHVFERFYRANPESAIPGIGLGLAIAAEIMHEHGGTILVESQFGSGSTFTLQLPIHSLAATHPKP
jgi:two-component system sensor histidine kinase BaeS